MAFLHPKEREGKPVKQCVSLLLALCLLFALAAPAWACLLYTSFPQGVRMDALFSNLHKALLPFL